MWSRRGFVASAVQTVASPRIFPLGSIEYSLDSLFMQSDGENLLGHWSA